MCFHKTSSPYWNDSVATYDYGNRFGSQMIGLWCRMQQLPSPKHYLPWGSGNSDIMLWNKVIEKIINWFKTFSKYMYWALCGQQEACNWEKTYPPRAKDWLMRWWGSCQHKEGREKPTLSPVIFSKGFSASACTLNCLLCLPLSPACAWWPGGLSRCEGTKVPVPKLCLPNQAWCCLEGPQSSSSAAFVDEPLFQRGRRGLGFTTP